MNNLQIIENQNQRVLLTSQLAEVYETTDRRIVDNFNDNKDRYQEGKHYYLLQGEDLKEFKSKNGNSGFAKNLNKLYLWTEKGAMLHAKSLNTDKAWEMYETLVDTYFEVKQPVKQLTQLEILAMQTNALLEMDKRVNAVEQTANKAAQKLENALEVFTKPTESGWKEETNRILNQMCVENNLNFSIFKHDLYIELEQAAKCDLNARQRNLRARLKEGGAKSAECTAVSKLDVVNRDDKLRLIFDGIVKRYQAKYLK